MNTFTLPEPILDQARTEAMRCKIPLDEFIADAVTEKLAALNAHSLLKERATKGNRNHFEAVLNRVPASVPESGDERI